MTPPLHPPNTGALVLWFSFLIFFWNMLHLGSYPHLVRILPMSTGGLPGSCPLGGKGERGERKEGRGERGEKGG